MKENKTSDLNQTKRKIFEASRKILQDKGVLGLTLAEAAAVAGVSKGGLLYHFPSKSELLAGLLDFEATTFELAVTEAAKKDGRRGAWTRAYIVASSEQARQGRSLSAIIGSLLLEPSLLPVYASHAARWTELLSRDHLPERIARMIRFAVEGLWFDEVCGLQPLNPAQRAEFMDELLAMTRVADVGH
ncbi:TetR/AcrR family transcriptional regulator [Burkholderia stagnalis]|nr:TetR/AcrR family transcriptional regulator [Burkholderia stagnalis]RQQ23606.1 TetR/AcrR family transcriptional regulator [Burkholderia stagnalis]RQQ41769.1 TetR/AcrR family transcriptional regulator [Burkholderia stagnalis]RQX85487.1 TetR/AcrR family transcriptional regulator [Burkholderia stagnalis]RQY04880.1 TetR/AcrR family transcriptional regulator [Burkholderia stagnalis]